jgi:hypothetical protein
MRKGKIFVYIGLKDQRRHNTILELGGVHCTDMRLKNKLNDYFSKLN